MKSISVSELKACCDSGQPVTIVDLQSPEGYAHRHIPGAIHIDVNNDCDAECQKILKDKDSQFVVYGEFDELGNGMRGVASLERAGYTNVANLEGGLMAWMEAGHAVEGGQES